MAQLTLSRAWALRKQFEAYRSVWPGSRLLEKFVAYGTDRYQNSLATLRQAYRLTHPEVAALKAIREGVRSERPFTLPVALDMREAFWPPVTSKPLVDCGKADRLLAEGYQP